MLWKIVKGQQVLPATRHDCIRTSLIITELNERGFVVKLLHDSSDLATCETLFRNIGEQRDRIDHEWYGHSH